jgi:hypothetical protein
MQSIRAWFRHPLHRTVQRARRLLPIQWFTAAMGILLTLGGTYEMSHRPGVFQSDAYVVFLPPKSFQENPLLPNGAIVTAAVVVATAVDSGNNVPTPTLDDIPLFSTGVEHGYLVTVPNSGSQWVPIFQAAQLHVQTTGTSEGEATARLHTVLARVEIVLRNLQSKAGSPPAMMIRTELSPAHPTTYYVKGNRLRSAGASFLLGLALTAIAIRPARRLPPLLRQVRIGRHRHPKPNSAVPVG